MHSFSDCGSGWSKEPQWKNDYGSFLPCFLLVKETIIFPNPWTPPHVPHGYAHIRPHNVPMVPLHIRYPWMSSVDYGYDTYIHATWMKRYYCYGVSLTLSYGPPESWRLNPRLRTLEGEELCFEENHHLPQSGNATSCAKRLWAHKTPQWTLCYGSASDEISMDVTHRLWTYTHAYIYIHIHTHTYTACNMVGKVMLLWWEEWCWYGVVWEWVMSDMRKVKEWL
jgi:hypothetical protein